MWATVHCTEHVVYVLPREKGKGERIILKNTVRQAPSGSCKGRGRADGEAGARGPGGQSPGLWLSRDVPSIPSFPSWGRVLLRGHFTHQVILGPRDSSLRSDIQTTSALDQHIWAEGGRFFFYPVYK